MKTINGDLLASPGPCVMVHACNALGVMGAGLALQVRLLFPEAERVYKASRHKLGTCSIAQVGPERWVANLVTQGSVGAGLQTDYDALEIALDDLMEKMFETGIDKYPIYLPVGMCCGLGGGDWAEVLTILKGWEYRNWLDLTLVEYTPRVKIDARPPIKKRNLARYR